MPCLGISIERTGGRPRFSEREAPLRYTQEPDDCGANDDEDDPRYHHG